MTETEDAAQAVLRSDILASGHNDFVSMADVRACIFDGVLKNMSTEHQQLVVATVRSLLEEGLVVVGDIPGRDDPGFKTWPGTIDQVMARFVDCFIGLHDDPIQWQYRIWLNLTGKGQQVSNALVGHAPD